MVPKSKRMLVIASNVAHDVKKWQWLYRWLDDNCVRLGKQMTDDHYQWVSTMKGGSLTSTALVTRLHNMARVPGIEAVDLFLNVHGREHSLKFADGWVKVAALADQIDALSVSDRLRLLYSSACYGAMHAPVFVEAGFKTASGARRVNANGSFDYPTQIAKWREGKTYESAVKAGNSVVMREIHDNLAKLVGFGDVDSEKEIAGMRGLRITSSAG